ncbi:hypothetical protein [Williamsoniiplasma lucivorax]|uniref:Uncharacterized protein n=1 Tax=Williamsoniiplasma lucivorax TaxID=209274 RepID=A0A2S5REL0_9MOLU|nr:hypothetical protein [Williamsoniiplasma lucivorax]PPE05751.1 hypothetical protein ELUCI_v1c00380 [Williamsoniiplasma lucivorax]
MIDLSPPVILGLLIASAVALPFLIVGLVYWSILIHKERKELRIRGQKFSKNFFKFFILYLLVLLTLGDLLAFIVFLATYVK